MKINYLKSLFLLSLLPVISYAQVGVATSDPKAQLDIQASVTAGNPANTDGILIPRISQFPTTNPGADQNAMLVYLTTTDTGRTPGFYFWDNGATAWSSISPSGSDDQALTINNLTATVSLEDGGAVKVSTIADLDSDTKVQVEEGADNDVIRFDIEGSEHFTMDTNGRLEVLNNGNSVFIGEGAGAADNLSDNRNVFIGKDAGMSVTNRIWNVAIGYEALKSATAGVLSNVAIGYQSQLNTSTPDNVTIGRSTLRGNVLGGSNVAVGTSSGGYVNGRRNVSMGTGSLNQTNGGADMIEDVTAVGYQSLSAFQNGANNAAFGNNALNSIRNGSDMTAIGADAGVRVTQVGVSSNSIFIGAFSGGDTEAPISTPQSTYSNSMIIGGHAGEFDTRAAITDRLIIEPSASATALIGGDFANDRVGINIDMTTPTVGAAAPTALTHTLTVGGSVKVQTLMNLEPTTAPASPSRGDVYYDNATNKVKVWTGAAWEDLN